MRGRRGLYPGPEALREALELCAELTVPEAPELCAELASPEASELCDGRELRDREPTAGPECVTTEAL